MRIKFLKPVDVELDRIPTTAWGRVQRRSTRIMRTAKEGFGIPKNGPLKTYFPAGAIVELPDDMAAGYIAAECAEVNVGENGPRITDESTEGIE